MSGKKKPEYPNNWQKFKDAPDEMFAPHSFFEVMDWKVAGWELPSNVDCVIRAQNRSTMKVKEYVYRRRHAAENKVRELMSNDDVEFTVCTHEQIHFISHRPLDDEEDDD